MDKMNTPTFTLAEASAAAGVQPARPRQWIAKKWLDLHPTDAPARTPGATTMLTGRTALKIGLAAHLSEVVSLEVAMRAADIFAYTGSDGGQERNGIVRRPGGIFKSDKVADTLAVFSRGQGRTDWQVAIVPLMEGMTIDQCIDSGSYGIHSCGVLIVLPLATVVETLRRNLDLQ